jgi:UDP-glucose 4-epimerase
VSRLLVTGATGKVGRAFLANFLADERFAGWSVRALTHSRGLPDHPRVEHVRGSIADRDVARTAMADVQRVVHLATCKETPDDAMDVSVKGLFWLLEEARSHPDFEQFTLLSGDAVVGHCSYPCAVPITEDAPFRPYPGCYPLSKVLEETMLRQYQCQYGLRSCCLRPSWIMAEDDFRYHLTFGEDVFGGPRWCDLVDAQLVAGLRERKAVPVAIAVDGQALKRSFCHVDDVVGGIIAALLAPELADGGTFHLCMDEPVDYRAVGAYLHAAHGLEAVPVATDLHSTWLDNTRAKHRLGWRPRYDLHGLIDSAWNYRRDATEPRTVWYPG